ncbi:MAG: hypothetical protein HQ580_05510 [Planctomycetes bacterium]|nr:hypothetical protein [Planctomycetota bacterium]
MRRYSYTPFSKELDRDIRNPYKRAILLAAIQEPSESQAFFTQLIDVLDGMLCNIFNEIRQVVNVNLKRGHGRKSISSFFTKNKTKEEKETTGKIVRVPDPKHPGHFMEIEMMD